MKNSLMKKAISFFLGVSMFAGVVTAGEVEVLHYWTSGGEAKSVAVLKELLEKEGHSWKDFAVAGGAGENAMTVLRTRVVSGSAPAAAQVKGPEIQNWGDEDVLNNLDDIAQIGGWDDLIPEVVADAMKYEGHYVAVPVNVHRVNWMWANPEVFRKAKVKIPTTWKEFFDAADKIQKAGFIPLAHGGQSWQDATVFESIVLGVGGADFYRSAFVDLDPDALNSPTMIKSFDIYRRLHKYVDRNSPGRDWNLATSMVIQGKAAMQFMGDWAKGEFKVADKSPGVDYICMPVPETSGAYTFNVDSFIMFDVDSKKSEKAQKAMARLILEPTFQTVFNVNKGSIPVVAGLERAPFDDCAHDSMDSFISSSATGNLVPSMAHGMSTFSAPQGAVYDVVTKFWNSSMSSKEAAMKLAKTVKASAE